MHLDPTAYLRIEAHQSIDTSAFGASFATSTGDILEVSSFGEGVFRMRMGPRTLPDYGIVQGRATSCEVTAGTTGPWRFVAGSYVDLGPSQVWARPRVPLVEGRDTTPFEQLLIVADSANGLSLELPAREWISIPTGLTVTVARRTPSMVAMNSWVRLNSSAPTASRHRSNHMASRSSLGCRQLHAVCRADAVSTPA